MLRTHYVVSRKGKTAQYAVSVSDNSGCYSIVTTKGIYPSGKGWAESWCYVPEEYVPISVRKRLKNALNRKGILVNI
jgi:hypothetical protein